MADSFIQDVVLIGEKTVTTAGTAEAVHSTAYLWKSLLIIAKVGNTGQVYYGGSTVDSATNDGLDATDSIEIKLGPNKWLPLTDVFIDVDNDGEGVDFVALF